ncbi:S-layer homology domain-containing protein [Paenibacillus sp. FSL H8-0548]|uniref:S-layer homology domain-containing protein n=1 Tax=Paenibacillus sp. FSL H8-0548 TaxID=1920422 RepID=UPI0015C3847C|nr:S-layer homology domain-containing protein [Paenibacillus sp. FSL H8-0548]
MTNVIRFILVAVMIFTLSGLSYTDVKAAEKQKALFEIKTLETNDGIHLTVLGKDLSDVYAFELQFEFDSLRLQFIGASTTWEGFTVNPSIKGKHILFAHTKVGNTKGVSGNATMTELRFKRIRGGNSDVVFKEARLVDSSLRDMRLNQQKQVQFPSHLQTVKINDIKNHWAETKLNQALELGVVTGYSNGTFRPDLPITRAEFSTLLARTLLLPAAQGVLKFTDEKLIPHWAKEHIAATVQAGLVKGYDDGTFQSDRLINRSEMAVMVVRALKEQPDHIIDLTFSDTASIPVWANPSVKLAVDQGLMQGRGGNIFAPLDRATRAEAVSILLDVLHKLMGA